MTRSSRIRPWRALLVLCVANFLVLLDTTIVNTAVPDIMGNLDVGLDQILWVLNGYLVALASLLIVFGRLGDMVGPRNRAGAASGVLNTARHAGTVLGAAVVGVLLRSNRNLAGADRATIVIAAVVLAGSGLALGMSRRSKATDMTERRPVRAGAQV